MRENVIFSQARRHRIDARPAQSAGKGGAVPANRSLSKPMRRRLLILAALASAAAMTPSAFAQASEALSAEARQKLAAVNAYLTGLSSVKARFNQMDPQGVMSSGVLWLKRPGRARFEYEPPSGLLVVADGKHVLVWDKRLKTFDGYPLGFTPLGLFLGKEVRLDKGVEITGLAQEERGFSVTARDSRRRSAGAITLMFSDQPLTLTGWVVTDAQGARTQVALGPLERVVDPDPELFLLQDPRKAKATKP